MTAKKLSVVKAAQKEAAARAAEVSGQATLDLADVAGAIQEGLLALSCTAGLLVMHQMMENELTAKVGPKGRHDAGRTATRHGRAQGSVVLGGRRVPLERPRARTHDGAEVSLDTWSTFASDDLLSQLVVERMLAGVATRRHREVSEPVGAELDAKARSTSRSAVSRRFKAATETALAELLARDLSALDVAALMIDGIVFADCCCVVALAITADGTKVPVGLWDGDTENTTVVKTCSPTSSVAGCAMTRGSSSSSTGRRRWRRASGGSSGTRRSSSAAPCTSAGT